MSDVASNVHSGRQKEGNSIVYVNAYVPGSGHNNFIPWITTTVAHLQTRYADRLDDYTYYGKI